MIARNDRRVRRTLTAAVFFVAFAAMTLPARAASTLTAIAVAPTRGGGARVTLGIAGGPPSNWHVTGAGTPEITVILPGAAQAPSLNQLSYPGVNNVSSVTINNVGNEIDVGVHLAAAAPIHSTATPNGVLVEVGAAAAATPPPAAAGPLPQSDVTRDYEVVPLKYADVSEVVGILVDGQQLLPNDTFQPQGSIFTLPSSTGAPQQPPAQFYQQAQQQPQSFGQRVSDHIAIDRRLNAVILSGTAQEVASLKAAIAKIDVPLPSVMLECEVVELSATAAHDLGLDFTSNGAGSPVLSSTGSVQNITAQTPDSHNYRATFQANLFATISHGGGRILATPRILALNGTPAQILTGDALPIITTTLTPSNPPILTQTVNYVAVGVNLQIQPRIASDDFVTSHIFAEVSSVTAFVPTQQGNVPQISLRQTSTIATVGDGQAFVVGGLLKDEEISTMSKIPVLGDLPVIGGLFRVRHDSNTKTNLYIIITPRIVHQIQEQKPPAGLPKPRVPGPTPHPATPAPGPTASPVPSSGKA